MGKRGRKKKIVNLNEGDPMDTQPVQVIEEQDTVEEQDSPTENPFITQIIYNSYDSTEQPISNQNTDNNKIDDINTQIKTLRAILSGIEDRVQRIEERLNIRWAQN